MWPSPSVAASRQNRGCKAVWPYLISCPSWLSSTHPRSTNGGRRSRHRSRSHQFPSQRDRDRPADAEGSESVGMVAPDWPTAAALAIEALSTSSPTRASGAAHSAGTGVSRNISRIVLRVSMRAGSCAARHCSYRVALMVTAASASSLAVMSAVAALPASASAMLSRSAQPASPPATEAPSAM